MLYRTSLPAFTRFAFREVSKEPDLIEARHIELFADRLMGVWKGEISCLLVNAPPGCGKSFCASVAFPLFAIGNDPSLNIVVLAGTRELSNALRERARALLLSERVRAVFPHLRPEAVDGAPLPGGGRLIFAAFGHPPAGHSVDLLILDDPQTPADVEDERSRHNARRAFDTGVAPRVVQGTGRTVMATPRLHPEDLSDHILQSGALRSYIWLPAIALQHQEWTLRDGTKMFRRRGEPLQPQLADRVALKQRSESVGAVAFCSHYLQVPFTPESSYRTNWWDQKREVDWHYKFGMPVYTRKKRKILGAYAFLDELFHPPQFGPPSHRPMTEREGEELGVAQQRDLLARVRASSAAREAGDENWSRLLIPQSRDPVVDL